jgi:hypothetical protein
MKGNVTTADSQDVREIGMIPSIPGAQQRVRLIYPRRENSINIEYRAAAVM